MWVEGYVGKKEEGKVGIKRPFSGLRPVSSSNFFDVGKRVCGNKPKYPSM
jgi:hypothetical protein